MDKPGKNTTPAGNISFVDIFDLGEIQHLQDLFSDANGVASVITHPDGSPITKPSNFCRLCSDIIRKTGKGLENCFRSDAIIGRQNPAGPTIQPCLSGGLWDAGTSITVGGVHVANWMIGQVRDAQIDEKKMADYAAEIGARRQDFMEALEEVPVMSVEQFTKVSNMLSAFTKILSEKAYNNLQLKNLIASSVQSTSLLQESEKNYLDIFQTVSEGIAHTTLLGKVLSVNRALEHILGIPKEEIVGQNIMKLAKEWLTEKNLKAVLPFLGSLILGNDTQTFQLEYNNKILEITTKVNLATRRMTGVVTDITERKRAEAELEESREKYQGLSDAAFESIFISENGICVEQNRTAEKIFGYTSDEAIGRYGTEWIVPADREKVMNQMLSGAEEPYPATALRKDGTTFPCMLRGKMMHYKGKRVRVTSLTDITRQTEMENILRESEDRFRTLIQSTPDIICFKDGLGRWLIANDAYIELFSLKGIDYFGKTDAELAKCADPVYENAFLTCLDSDEKTWQSGGVYRTEEASPGTDGSLKIFDVLKVPLFNADGSRQGLVILARNVSDRKQMIAELTAAKEKAEQSDRLKSTFLANMSHEIRTPMNAIIGFAGLLIDPDISGEDRHLYAGIVQSRSDDLMRIINDILEISRIESGNATIQLEKVYINQILEEISTVTSKKTGRFNKSHLAITCVIPDQPGELTFQSDPFIIKQVFTNLIDNAIKFTENGTIRYGYHLPENGRITCFVADTGIGISQDNQSLIFEHFRQAERQNVHQYGGTGLGLSICKGSLELLGGDIRVESIPGTGTTFYFSLPFILTPDPVVTGSGDGDAGTAVPAKRYNWHGRKILLVEDDDNNMRLLTAILSRTGAELICTFNGEEVRKMYSQLSNFHLVLLDIRLPDSNGWELAKEIKTIREELPVIAQTAYAMSSDREKSIDAGCDDYIAKPIKKDQLLRLMSFYLD